MEKKLFLPEVLGFLPEVFTFFPEVLEFFKDENYFLPRFFPFLKYEI
jgi:hypothetical protein